MTNRMQYELIRQSTGPFFHCIRRSFLPFRPDNVPEYVIVVVIVIVIVKIGEVEEEVGRSDVVAKVHWRAIVTDRGECRKRHIIYVFCYEAGGEGGGGYRTINNMRRRRVESPASVVGSSWVL